SIIDGKIFVTDPQLPPVPTAPTGATDLGTINSSRTITAGSYIVSSITLHGSETLTINSSGGPVRLYVTGDISITGSAELVHNGTLDQFAIFGLPDDGNNVNAQQFTLNGGSTATNVFIYAPDAQVGINGGSSNPDIQGAVWAREWNGSSSNNAEIAVPRNIAQSLGSAFGVGFQNAGAQVTYTSPPTTWSRQEAN
ncbi:MAG: DUF7305 domain-containing protein, partial [Brasilonema sp.]